MNSKILALVHHNVVNWLRRSKNNCTIVLQLIVKMTVIPKMSLHLIIVNHPQFLYRIYRQSTQKVNPVKTTTTTQLMRAFEMLILLCRIWMCLDIAHDLVNVVVAVTVPSEAIGANRGQRYVGQVHGDTTVWWEGENWQVGSWLSCNISSLHNNLFNQSGRIQEYSHWNYYWKYCFLDESKG